MTIYNKIYADADDHQVESSAATWASVRTGSSLTLTTGAATLTQEVTTAFSAKEAFVRFDTSAISSPASAAMFVYRTAGTGNTLLRAKAASWSSASTANWQGNYASSDEIVSFANGAATSAYQQGTDLNAGLLASITAGGWSSFAFCRPELVSGAAQPGSNNGATFASADASGTTTDPFIIVTESGANTWQFVAVSAVTEVTTTSMTLTEPTGAAQGDLLVAVISSRTTATTSITLPAGWALVDEQKNNSTATTTSALASGMMAYIIRGSSAPSYAFTLPAGISVALGRVIAYRNAAQSSTKDANTSFTTATNTTAVSGTGLTTTQDDDLIVAAACGGQEASWTNFAAATDPTISSGTGSGSTAHPSAGVWQERADSNTTTGADTSLAIFDAVKTTTGATGNLTATASQGAGHVVVAGAFKLATASGPVDYTDTITSGSLPIGGQSVTPNYGRNDTLAASSLDITGQSVADVFGRTDTIAAGALPITGQTLNDSAALSDSITASAIPIAGQAVADVFGYTDSISAGAVPVTGQSLSDALALTESIAAGSLPIGGQTITPAYGRTDSLTASSLPIAGQALTDVFAVTESIAAGAVPIAGQSITDAFGRTDAISAGALPISGQSVADVLGYTDGLAAGSLPISGQAVADVLSFTDTITPSSVPITGQSITPTFSAGGINYSDTLTAGSVPIAGQTVSDVLGFTDSISAGAVPITGQAVNESYGRTDAIAVAPVPVTGQNVAPVFGRTDAIAAASVPITGQSVAPVLTGSFADTIEAASLPIVGAEIIPLFSVGVPPSEPEQIGGGGRSFFGTSTRDKRTRKAREDVEETLDRILSRLERAEQGEIEPPKSAVIVEQVEVAIQEIPDAEAFRAVLTTLEQIQDSLAALGRIRAAQQIEAFVLREMQRRREQDEEEALIMLMAS